MTDIGKAKLTGSTTSQGIGNKLGEEKVQKSPPLEDVKKMQDALEKKAEPQVLGEKKEGESPFGKFQFSGTGSKKEIIGERNFDKKKEGGVKGSEEGKSEVGKREPGESKNISEGKPSVKKEDGVKGPEERKSEVAKKEPGESKNIREGKPEVKKEDGVKGPEERKSEVAKEEPGESKNISEGKPEVKKEGEVKASEEGKSEVGKREPGESKNINEGKPSVKKEDGVKGPEEGKSEVGKREPGESKNISEGKSSVKKEDGVKGPVEAKSPIKAEKGLKEEVKVSSQEPIGPLQGQQMTSIGPLGQPVVSGTQQAAALNTSAQEMADLASSMLSKILISNEKYSANNEIRMTFSKDDSKVPPLLRDVEFIMTQKGDGLEIKFLTKTADAENFINQNKAMLNDSLLSEAKTSKGEKIQDIHIDIVRTDADTQDQRDRRAKTEYIPEEEELQ